MTVAQFESPIGASYLCQESLPGSILVFNTRTKTVSGTFDLAFADDLMWVEQMVARHKVPGAGVMKGFDFAKSGR